VKKEVIPGYAKILYFLAFFALIVFVSIVIADELFSELPQPVVSEYKVEMPENIRLHNCSVFDTQISFCYDTPVYVSLKYDSPFDAVFSVIKDTGEKIIIGNESFTRIDFVEYCGEKYDPNVEMCIETIPSGSYKIDFVAKLEFSKRFGRYGMLYYGLIFAMILVGLMLLNLLKGQVFYMSEFHQSK